MVYVAATVPYLFLLILFIRGLTFNIEGAVKGLKVFLIPRWEDLMKFSVITYEVLEPKLTSISKILKEIKETVQPAAWP